MEPIAIVTVLVALQTVAFAFLVGKQRVKHGVKAPTIGGDPEFERAFRVHQNTVEQLVVFLPALWIFGYYVHAPTGAGLGLVFVIARFIYRGSYLKDPSSRGPGFGIGMIATAILLFGGLVGAIRSLL